MNNIIDKEKKCINNEYNLYLSNLDGLNDCKGINTKHLKISDSIINDDDYNNYKTLFSDIKNIDEFRCIVKSSYFLYRIDFSDRGKTYLYKGFDGGISACYDKKNSGIYKNIYFSLFGNNESYSPPIDSEKFHKVYVEAMDGKIEHFNILIDKLNETINI